MTVSKPMRWTIKEQSEGRNAGLANLDLDPVVVELLMRRDVVDSDMVERFFMPDYDRHLHDPFLFVDLPKVVERVDRAMRNKEAVGVFGDFDADGVTGSALLRQALEGLGLHVTVHIPDKTDEGHGISLQGIEKFRLHGVSLMFTVDCGISDHDKVDAARALGMDVIIIDHHHIPVRLPDALAAINPQMVESGYPFKGLCGAGTAFKVAQGLYEKLAPENKASLKWLLDLVAIGTVADCMPLVDENRVLVKYGLIVLAKTRRPGLKELYSIGRMRIDEDTHPNSTTIGFHIAPHINAAGRMAHAQKAHDLLVENDVDKARDLAIELSRFNRDRQKLSAEITKNVRDIVLERFADKKFILAAERHFALGIVGLVAGKIAGEFNKPTAVLQMGDEFSQGSFRSIPGINVIEIIEQCSDLLVKFGGHAQAAGMTIANRNLDNFYRRFHDIVEEALQDRSLEPEILIDAVLGAEYLSMDFAETIRRFEPFGVGNREPVFLFERMRLVSARTVGSDNKHLKTVLCADSASTRFDGIGFGLGERLIDLKSGDMLDIVGNVDENEWNGRKSVQLRILDIRKTDPPH